MGENNKECKFGPCFFPRCSLSLSVCVCVCVCGLPSQLPRGFLHFTSGKPDYLLPCETESRHDSLDGIWVEASSDLPPWVLFVVVLSFIHSFIHSLSL